MKAVILSGGLGTRLSEETSTKPKPMVEIGGMPILWHILKLYSNHGINDFVICCGYKGYLIKEFFANYFLHTSDITFDLEKNLVTVHQKKTEPWRVTLVDTGEVTLTGGRLKRVKDFLDADEDFCFTYGDGVSDVDITQQVMFHRNHRKLATVLAVQPQGRFGALVLNGESVQGFQEKPLGDGGWINGGFFVLNPKVIDCIVDDQTAWEGAPLQTLAGMDELMAFEHRGFWQPMDTLRDKNYLEELWASGRAPWKCWD
jgi:glucose-1-phosphate cytidylyltransferase